MVFFVKRTKGHDPKNEANFLDTPLNFHGFTKKPSTWEIPTDYLDVSLKFRKTTFC